MNWTPVTFEDHLLAKYHLEHPGELFLELEVGDGDEGHGPRRLDGVLIPGPESIVHPRGSFSTETVMAAITGSAVHLLEAKRTLNRGVVGQVAVGTILLRTQFEPWAIESVAVCGDGNLDVENACNELGIRTVIYSVEV
jgi:hypothetical protein